MWSVASRKAGGAFEEAEQQGAFGVVVAGDPGADGLARGPDEVVDLLARGVVGDPFDEHAPAVGLVGDPAHPPATDEPVDHPGRGAGGEPGAFGQLTGGEPALQVEDAEGVPVGGREVRAVLTELVAAWGRHDADACGAMFTDEATYTTFVGSLYRGRAAIVESHRALFGSFLKGATLADERIEVHFPAPDVAVVTSRGDVVKGRRRKPLGKAQTYTLARSDGGWRIAAFHTKRRPLMERISARLQPATAPT